MKIWRLLSIGLTVIATAALVGAASAQDNPPVNPTPQPGQHFNYQGQPGQDNNQTWQDDPGRHFPGRGQSGDHNPQNNTGWHWDGRRGDYPIQSPVYTYVAPSLPNAEVTGAPVVIFPTQADILNQIVQIVAQSLNMPASTITAQMNGGLTLKQVIAADGGTDSTVTSQIITGITTWLDNYVSTGLVTQAHANEIFSDLSNIVQRALDGSFTQSNGVVLGLVVV